MTDTTKTVEPVAWKQRIYGLLREYRQDEVHDEDGYGYPLVDALTLDGHGIDMGEREIMNIADMLAGELALDAANAEIKRLKDKLNVVMFENDVMAVQVEKAEALRNEAVDWLAARLVDWWGRDNYESNEFLKEFIPAAKVSNTGADAALRRMAAEADRDALVAALSSALEWIDAVPTDTPLPTMPGFDRDEADQLISGSPDAIAALEARDARIRRGGWEAGMKAAAAIIAKRRDHYINEHGIYDHTTGVTEFPGDGDEWVGEWSDCEDAILSAIKDNRP